MRFALTAALLLFAAMFGNVRVGVLQVERIEAFGEPAMTGGIAGEIALLSPELDAAMHTSMCRLGRSRAHP